MVAAPIERVAAMTIKATAAACTILDVQMQIFNDNNNDREGWAGRFVVCSERNVRDVTRGMEQNQDSPRPKNLHLQVGPARRCRHMACQRAADCVVGVEEDRRQASVGDR